MASPGSEMMGEIMNGSGAGDRMEYELFSRLVRPRELQDRAFVV